MHKSETSNKKKLWDHKEFEGKDECYFYASRKTQDQMHHEKWTVADASQWQTWVFKKRINTYADSMEVEYC